MKNCEQILTGYYEANRLAICSYIARRIPHSYMAEDLTQDVFIRLWNVRQTICETTIKSLAFTVAKNIVTDHLRRYIRKRTIDAYMFYSEDKSTNETSEKVIANDLADRELRIVTSMPPKRRRVYMLNRYDDMSIDDIATEMNMSRRTVETHLFLGRKEMRTQFKKCV